MFILFLSFYAVFLAVICLLLLIGLSHLETQKLSVSAANTAIANQTAAQTKQDQQLAFWLNALKKQPTSRDILINISLIYQSKGDLKLAKAYREKAVLIDPNHQNLREN